MFAKVITGELVYPPLNLETPEGILFNYCFRTDLLFRDGYTSVRYEYSNETTERFIEDKGEYILVVEPQEPEMFE